MHYLLYIILKLCYDEKFNYIELNALNIYNLIIQI